MTQLLEDKLWMIMENLIEMINGSRDDEFDESFEQIKLVLTNLSDNSDKFIKFTELGSILLQSYLKLIEIKYKEDEVKENLWYILLLWFTNDLFKEYKTILNDYWHLLIKFTPVSIDKICISQLLIIAFSSKPFNWLCSKILVNALRSSESKGFAKSIVSLLLENDEYFAKFFEIIKANNNFTNCNYLIEIINRITGETFASISGKFKESNNSNNFINRFPHNSIAGDFEIVSFLQQTNKIFTNIYQLSYISNSDNSICSNKLTDNYSFIQIVDNIMIIWTTTNESKLSPSFVRLKNLDDYETSNFYRITLKFTSLKGEFRSSTMLTDKSIENEDITLELKKKDNFASFERILIKYTKKKIKKISICNYPLMFVSKLEQEKSHNELKVKDKPKDSSVSKCNVISDEIIVPDSLDIPGNQLAAFKADSKIKSNTSKPSKNSQKTLSGSQNTPLKYIEVMRKESKKYGKKRRTINKIKDIWEIASSDSVESNPPTTHKNSIIPDSLSNFTPLRNSNSDSCEYLHTNIEPYSSESDSPLVRKRKKNIIYPSMQSEFNYSQCNYLDNNKSPFIEDMMENNSNLKKQKSDMHDITKNENKSFIGDSTTITEKITLLENTNDAHEIPTANTTFHEFQSNSEYNNLISKGMNLLSTGILYKIKSLEEFIHQKENEMKHQLELDFKKINDTHKENMKELYDFFVKETENISKPLK